MAKQLYYLKRWRGTRTLDCSCRLKKRFQKKPTAVESSLTWLHFLRTLHFVLYNPITITVGPQLFQNTPSFPSLKSIIFCLLYPNHPIVHAGAPPLLPCVWTPVMKIYHSLEYLKWRISILLWPADLNLFPLDRLHRARKGWPGLKDTRMSSIVKTSPYHIWNFLENMHAYS